MGNQGQVTCGAMPRAEVIARSNDRLRREQKGGTIVVTRSVSKLTGYSAAAIADALANYDGFDHENDPHGERDFGDLVLFGTDLLWKIDYYDRDHKYGSDDPANPDITCRVLTVMMAMDW